MKAIPEGTSNQAILDLSGPDFVGLLDNRIAALYAEIQKTPMWALLQDPNTDIELLKLVMREVYFEISTYQPHVIEAAITAIGHMPRSLDERTVKAMLRHQAEEFTHGEMALRDYAALGGDVAWAREQRMSSASYAVASVWMFIAHERDPFAYLGALYPFEGLTPQVSGGALETLIKRGFPQDALEFVTFHAEEDPRHTALVRALIERIADKFPESRESMLAGIENFLSIYPLPVWETAYNRALNYYQHSAAA
jgi:pyrroloquinoline quinone (PQQ) biosynthesis protein C